MASSSRRDPPLIGRREVVEEVRRRLEEPRSARVTLLLLVGEGGVGKSTLLTHVLKEAEGHGALVLRGRALPMDLPQPFFVLQEALRSLPAHPSPDAATTSGVAGMGVLGMMGSPTMTPLGFLPFTSEGEGTQERETSLSEALATSAGRVEEGRTQLFERITNHLESLAADRLLVLALEDLHYADDASLEFLGHFARRIRGESIKVLATALPEAEQPARLKGHLEGLGREGFLQRLEVRRMTEGEAQEYIARLAGGRPIPAATITRWYSLTEGNPLFLEQLLRGELAQPAPAAGTASTPRTVPDGAELGQVLKRRVRTLNEADKKVLAYASVLGREFPFSLLHKASGEDEEKLAESVESLVRSGLLREKGNERYEFCDEDLRAETYTSLTEVRRRILHRKVAEALEATPEGDPHRLYELARHTYLAQSDDKALEYNRKAAALAATALAPETAALHLERALECYRRLHPGGGEEERALTMDLALQVDLTGEAERAAKLLETTLSTAHAAHVKGREAGVLALTYARVLTHVGRYGEARPVIEEAIRELSTVEEPRLLGNAYRVLASMDYYAAHYEAALASYQTCLALFEKVGGAVEAARAKLSVAEIQTMLGTTRSGQEELYRTAIAELKKLGEQGELAYALNNFGLLYSEQGRLDEAVQVLEEGLEAAEASHDPRRIGWLEFNLADVLIHSEKIERAQALNEKARQHLQRVGDKLGLCQVALNEARLMESRHDWDHAELALLEAFRLAREVGFEPDELECTFRMAEFLLRKGDLVTARARVNELEQRKFATIRPELAKEFATLQAALSTAEGSAPAGEAHRGPA